ncbi:mediator complex subunit 13 C-terminal-domain-containing protein [Xylariomycetidae sp. FL0641]|nr:mediator complex subunit 13 C-terminal-domain-containing protein [Xylariomycetidae sp. FL0641]
MDTGEYETNALVINNISSVAFAFYEPAASSPSLFSPTVADLEDVLRKEGYLTYVDATRKGFWCFRVLLKGKADGTLPEPSGFPRALENTGCNLQVVEEGCFEPSSLVKTRPHGPNSANTPSSSSSAGSAALDPTLRSAQSATAPFLPSQPPEPESKAVTSLDGKQSSTTSVKDAYDCLILAVLSGICANLCARTGAIPLNSRILLLSTASQNESGGIPAVLASLRVYLTTSGSLVMSMNHSFAESLVALPESSNALLPPLGVTVLAAPLGVFATCHSSLIPESVTEASLGQSPDTQVLKPRTETHDGQWKGMCSRLLLSRHIQSSQNRAQRWIALQRVRRRLLEPNPDGKRTPMVGAASSMSWPAELCFCKLLSTLSIKGETEEPQRSKSELSYDPLNVARAWFLGSGERDELLAAKKRERETASTQARSSTEGHAQNSSGLSPLALRHNNPSGPPPSGMYPTPPDGIQSIVGVTPSMDGTLSSPGNNAAGAATVMMDIDTIAHAQADKTGETGEGPEPKRERISSSFDSENLFGELGPDMFGDNDITEADFSFFDEQPGGIDLGSLDIPDISNTDANLGLESTRTIRDPPEIKPGPTDVRLPDIPPPPVFAKPELRHARSSLGEEARRQTVQSTAQSEPPSLKRPPSPFNPDTVYKRIRASLDNYSAVQQNSRLYAPRQSSIFEKVDFGPGLSMVNSKYEGSGRFDYSADQEKLSKSADLGAPSTADYLKRHGKNKKGLKDLPTPYGDLYARVNGNASSVSNRPSPQNLESLSDADEGSLVSDQDDSSYDSDGAISPVKSVTFRRLRIDDDGESLATSFREVEAADVSSAHMSLEFPRDMKSEADVPLAKYFADPEPPWIQYSLADDQLIMAAQLLMDQFSTSTLPLNTTAHNPLASNADRRRHLLNIARNSMHELRSALPSCLKPAVEIQFKPFTEVQDVPLLGQPTRLQPRPPGTEQLRPNSLFQIPLPRLEMRRYDSRLSVLPSSVAFWESLGLSPSQGSKDVHAVCVFPDQAGLADDMLSFTDRMRSTYESLKLGSFNRLPTTSAAENGLFAFDVERDVVSFGKPTSFMGPSLHTCASKICKALSSAAVGQTNFVIFFVYSSDAAGSAVECCAVFNEIFEGYRKNVSNKKLRPVSELALQLIPQEFVSSSTSIAMPSPTDYAKLALEMYDRCAQFGGAMPSPAIVLEQPPPRMIDFKLTTTPSVSVLHENMCLHIAYAQSIDERWVSAAWTDSRGSQQMTASYCLGRKGKSLATPLTDVVTEIWATTRDLISAWKVHWRVMIAKCGVMEPNEVEHWTSLAQAETRAMINLTLVTVDTDPSLQLLPPPTKLPASAPAVFYTTPASTPQPSSSSAIVSPEQSGNNPPTPLLATSTPSAGGNNPASENAAANDDTADASLVDATDQTWGAVLAHRLNISATLTDLRPALASGYLAKRVGSASAATTKDAPALLEVNLIHADGSPPRAYEMLLREVLAQYRGLGTLARARGVTDRETDVRPWHVAAAEKGVRALYLLM